ncbi:MAG: Trk family potassium uptake protein [Oscillospiraceae bacterium]|nr:Trk family potassium uptake protein [Oscillospiraceae bacterium]
MIASPKGSKGGTFLRLGFLIRKNHTTASFQVILLGFLGLILLGALLLMLPLCSRDGRVTPFADTLFTSVSAACVTGLVVQDTATHWTVWGQLIILALIQIGGLGVITVAVTFFRLWGRRISLAQRNMMQQSISAPQVGGIVRRTGFILRGSIFVELCGALLLLPVFVRDYGFAKGLWYSVFHSISAFCNAGFDLMGVREKYSSLTSYGTDAWVNTVIMLLIIVGGIGFLVWEDLQENCFHLRRLRLQTKLVLVTSVVLILLPAGLNFLLEYRDLPLKERILASLFQSVTTRTAGFNTADLTKMSEPGILQMIALMLVGGSPGSTAGGMKTTTVAVLFLAGATVFRRRDDVECFRRRIGQDAIRNAGTILFLYLMLFTVGSAVLSRVEDLPLLTCMFETSSAVGTVGLTLGITPSLHHCSRIILMILMFLGRVGALTLVYALLPGGKNPPGKKPLETVTVG